MEFWKFHRLGRCACRASRASHYHPLGFRARAGQVGRVRTSSGMALRTARSAEFQAYMYQHAVHNLFQWAAFSTSRSSSAWQVRTLDRVHDLPEDHHPGTLHPVSGCAGLAGIPILGPHHDPSSAGTRLLQEAALVLSERSSRRFIFTNRHASGISPIIASEPSPCLPTPLSQIAVPLSAPQNTEIRKRLPSISTPCQGEPEIFFTWSLYGVPPVCSMHDVLQGPSG
jgi:hypothetical protein